MKTRFFISFFFPLPSLKLLTVAKAMLRHRYGSPTAFAVSCLGIEKNKIVKIFGFSLSMSIV